MAPFTRSLHEGSLRCVADAAAVDRPKRGRGRGAGQTHREVLRHRRVRRKVRHAAGSRRRADGEVRQSGSCRWRH